MALNDLDLTPYIASELKHILGEIQFFLVIFGHHIFPNLRVTLNKNSTTFDTISDKVFNGPSHDVIHFARSVGFEIQLNRSF